MEQESLDGRALFVSDHNLWYVAYPFWIGSLLWGLIGVAYCSEFCYAKTSLINDQRY
jgi:hypothetical protein